jgi:rhamnose utilization protein RhaD (predicted bifunctional aldolase and dehydrogenase)
MQDNEATPAAILVSGQGVLIRRDATSSQNAMLKCLSDVLLRLPKDWTAEPIGAEAEAELLDWDAEKYRQALAARS